MITMHQLHFRDRLMIHMWLQNLHSIVQNYMQGHRVTRSSTLPLQLAVASSVYIPVLVAEKNSSENLGGDL